MDNWIGVDLWDAFHDALLELLPGFDSDMPEEGSAHLGEEGFHQVEPRAVFRGMNINEPVRPGRQIGPRFFRDVGRVVVQNNADGGLGRIMGIDLLEKGDEFPAPVFFVYLGNDASILKVERGQDGDGPQSLVLVVPRNRLMMTRDRRKIGGDGGESLDPRLLVVTDRDEGPTVGGSLLFQGHLLVDSQDLAHLPVEVGILAFEVVSDLVRLQGLSLKDAVDSGLGGFGKTGMPRFPGMGPNIVGQSAPGPEFRGQPQILGFRAGQGNDPRLGLRRDHRVLRTMVEVGQSGQDTHRQGLVDAFVDGQALNADLGGDLLDGGLPGIGQEDPGPLNLPQRGFPGGGQGFEIFALLLAQVQGGPLCRSGHGNLLDEVGESSLLPS